MTPDDIATQTRLSFDLAAARKELRETRQDTRLKLRQADNIVDLVLQHFHHCHAPDLEELAVSWAYDRGFPPPVTADEVHESSFEMRDQR